MQHSCMQESQAVLLKIQQQLAGNVQLGAPGRVSHAYMQELCPGLSKLFCFQKYVGVGSVEVVSSGKKNPRILFLVGHTSLTVFN